MKRQDLFYFKVLESLIYGSASGKSEPHGILVTKALTYASLGRHILKAHKNPWVHMI